ncbi:hypothetical protein G4B88_030510 [Cannabis sativa]|uniref:CCT domain-containing protein n=1 Tax=Cannabis sativa TaxID=3483 RepID=A0A7J6FM18_CANSA|nr:hypothetical protein G4B88_030510 [Cannabis sativa]
MGCNALLVLRSPKKEEQQVPVATTTTATTTDLSEGKDSNLKSEDVDIMEDLERILGINEEAEEVHNKLTNYKGNYVSQLNWEFMEWNKFPNNIGDQEVAEEDDEEEEVLLSEQKNMSLLIDKDYYEKNYKCFFEEDDDEEEEYLEEENNDDQERHYRKGDNNLNTIKKEEVGFSWDDHDYYNKNNNKGSLNLNLSLNYQEVLEAWSDRGSLWADEYSLSMASSNGSNNYMGEVPVLMEEEKRRREASVLRYKEKRQTRLFSKKIRYQVRKLNADKRPRLKGRFVKRV